MSKPINYTEYEKQLKCSILEIDLAAKKGLYVNVETAYNNRVRDGEWLLNTLRELGIANETIEIIEDQYAKYIERNPVPTVLDDNVDAIRGLSNDTKTAVKKSIKSNIKLSHSGAL